MSNTLTYSGTTIPLPPDLSWPNEFWSPVKQAKEFSITGSLIVDSGVATAGRPITLQGGESFGWMARSTVSTLATWAAVPGAQMVLSVRGTTFNVIFDHDATGFEPTPVVDYADPQSTDWYTATLRFIEV